MRQPDWMKRWQRRVMPAASEAALRVVPRPQHRMAGAYHPLHAYLQGRYADNAVLSFEQIESLLGFALPDEARALDDWWAGREADGDADAPGHADAWRLAGRTATPNFLARTVSFERVAT